MYRNVVTEMSQDRNGQTEMAQTEMAQTEMAQTETTQTETTQTETTQTETTQTETAQTETASWNRPERKVLFRVRCLPVSAIARLGWDANSQWYGASCHLVLRPIFCYESYGTK